MHASPTSLERVPIEILDAIFSCLPPHLADLYACCLVNRAWFNSAHVILWKSMDVYAHQCKKDSRAPTLQLKRETDLTLSYFFSGRTYATVLAKPRSLTRDYRGCIQKITLIAGSPEWASGHEGLEFKLPSFVKILKFASRLTVLNLNFPALNDDDLWTVSASCKQLQALSIVSGTHPTNCVTDEGICAVARNCREMRHLRLKSLRRTDKGMCFSARGFRAIADAYAGQLDTFALDCAGSGIVRLLDSSGDEDRRVQEALGDVLLRNPELSTLSLDWPVALDDTLEVAASHTRSLRAFRVGSASNTVAVTAILRANKCLRSVTLNELSTLNPVTAFLDPLAFHTRLTHLTLDGIGFLNDILPCIPTFTQLTHIQITPSVRVASVHHHMTDNNIASIADACPHLESLVVSIQTDLPLLRIALNCPNLRVLDIGDGKDVTDSAVMLLARRCTELHTLHLGTSQNGNISDASLVVLAASLPKLVRLTLPFDATSITWRTLAALAEGCPLLEGLANVRTELGFTAFMKYFPMMHRLVGLTFCMGRGSWRDTMDREQVDQLKKSCRRLNHISYC
ncbi:hypothetical protein HKX48_007576 [Thoreauomyces humboldtii]|nr:hypothetical protein HKX48_007576 [Thoreauomyces humboldtii]